MCPCFLQGFCAALHFGLFLSPPLILLSVCVCVCFTSLSPAPIQASLHVLPRGRFLGRRQTAAAVFLCFISSSCTSIPSVHILASQPFCLLLLLLLRLLFIFIFGSVYFFLPSSCASSVFPFRFYVSGRLVEFTRRSEESEKKSVLLWILASITQHYHRCHRVLAQSPITHARPRLRRTRTRTHED